MTGDWREVFGETESEMYELLLDCNADAWHIAEVVQDHGLSGGLLEGAVLVDLLGPIRTSLKIVEEVLVRCPEVVPPMCLRPGRYPWIRQRRDVHQFDVGSHLACCCALSLRGVAPVVARRAGAPGVATALESHLAASHPALMPAAALLHDMFKCFRPRRSLPSKLGPKHTIPWSRLLGCTSVSDDADEIQVALVLLDRLLEPTALREELTGCLESSKLVSDAVAKLREKARHEAYETARAFWREHPMEPTLARGLALYVADVSAKGSARYVPVRRKGLTWSLDAAREVLLHAAEAELSSESPRL